MSEAVQPAASDPIVPEVVRQRWLAAAERRLAQLGDWLNPILVKETRQALKSRQFVATFSLLLIFCWAWSIFGLWLLGPGASYGVRGPEMLLGYHLILAFPLLVIVPFGAFRSLASEQEEHTYELLWITALKPRQIVSGKLGSAVLQMLIYLSAVSPCLAFTYMLRGVSVLTILFLLGYTFLASLGFSLIGLLVGTLSGEKHVQVLLSVVLVVGLLLAFMFGIQMSWAAVFHDPPFANPEFWQVNAVLLTAYLSYVALLFTTAVARITFASDNRSTPLRVVMLAQHVLLTGWVAWGVLAHELPLWETYFCLAGIHWYVMGTLMTGESPVLSLRVRRQLPESFLGRTFLTWFNPGPGTGYVFAVCGMLGALGMVLLAALFAEATFFPNAMGRSSFRVANLLVSGTLVTCYVVIFLGLGLFVVSLVRRMTPAGLLLSVLMQILLLVLGCGVPMIIQTMSPPSYPGEYSLLHLSNPFWTLSEIIDGNTLPVEAHSLMIILPLAAVAVFALNLPAIVRELRYVRVAKPARVAEEDAALAARFAPAQPTRLSPWDD